ncbi:histone-lysine N-methyltransferase ASH1L isoform X2 [Misgurnus anguillicaudatus]|uniref:histone-lysine N-methyltransferase ASH1L isoform X2 n=1 Tax=Misgurnus anguillicaudatus TaxID=75329 RepID=UPI003CCF7FD0
MDKRKQKTAPAPRLEREKKKEKIDDRKKMKPKASSKSTNSELQQQSRQDNLTVMKSDQSEENVRMKIGFGAKRTKKPPKSLENFICKPTVRISQRLAHGDAHGSCGGERSSAEITRASQSRQESPKTDSNDCISSKAPSTPLPTSSKKADSTPLFPTSKKGPSKQTKKTDSKSILTSDGPSYAVQPQTDSTVPLSDRITSFNPLKQTYSPPAAPSPPSSLQQNSSPHDGTQVFNVQRSKGEDLPTETTITASLPSQSSKDTMLKAQTSQQSSTSFEIDSERLLLPNVCSDNSQPLKQTPCPTKKTKTSKIRDSTVEKCLNGNVKEDGKQDRDSAGSKNMFKAVPSKRSKENDSVHQTSPYIPLALPASSTSADSSIHESNACSSLLLESKGRNKKHSEGEDKDESQKMTLEPTQTVPVFVQPKDSSRHIIGKNKKRARHNSDNAENVLCSSQTTSCADSQYNTSIRSTDKTSGDETTSHPKQITNLQKKQKVVQITKVANQVEKMNLVKTANVSSTACKTVSQTAKPKKRTSIKSSKTLAPSQCKPRPVGRPPKLQNPSPKSDVSSLEDQHKKRGRPRLIRLDESPQASKSQKSLSKSPILEHTNVLDPAVDLKLQKPVRRKPGRPRLSSLFQPQRSGSLDSGSLKKSAEDTLKPSLSKTKDAQIYRKRNRLIMKTIIKNINKMKMKKRDEVLKPVLSGQTDSHKEDLAHKGSVEDADPTQSLSSLVTSFGGKLGPQINVSKRGTIYIGKRRGRKPKTQRENSSQDSQPILAQKSQQVAESSRQVNSWFTLGDRSHSSDNQSTLSSSSHLFKHPESTTSTVGCFRKKLHTGSCEYDQHSASKPTSSQKVKAIAEEKSKPRSSLQSTPLRPATTQLGSVRMQDCRAAHLAQSVLMEQERLKYKCHRKGHSCFTCDKIRRHKHKCKRKYLQLRAKRQDPAFLAEVEDLVVRLSAIRIVHNIAQGVCGDEANSGRKSSKGKNRPHNYHCIPQNLHHPTMFQINFSGYYSPQSDFPRDSLHYVGMPDLKGNNRCPSQPGEHIVTHCPVVHKLGFPVTGGSCYHSPCKMPLSTTSFGFGLYRGYPPSATIYPSSPFLPSYVHPYSKNPILSPSKFHKRKHKTFLRRDSALCGEKPQRTSPNVTSQSSRDWFSRNSWQRVDNREKRLADDRLRGQTKLRKDYVSRRGSSSNSPFSSPMPLKKADKHKPSLLSYIGPSHLRPISKVRWAEHQRSWRWRGSVQSERSNSSLDQEPPSGYQEDDTFEGPESDEDLTSPSLSDQTIHHNTFQQNLNIASSTKSQMTAHRSTAEVQCASRNLMGHGSSLMKDSCSSGDKRASESFRPGGPVFHERYQHLTEGQDGGGRHPRHNMSKTFVQTNKISPFSSAAATKTLLSHSNSSTTLSKSKLKHVNKPLMIKTPQAVTGSEVWRRRPGRPRKNPAPCFSPSPQTAPSLDVVTECPSKRRKGETDNNTVVSETKSVSQRERRRGRKKKNSEKVSDLGQVDDKRDTAVNRERSGSCDRTSLPSQDTPVSVPSQSERSSTMPPDKRYEWAGLYSDVYKTKEPKSLYSPENTEGLEFDPEEHEYGLLPAPLHVGKYLRLKRIDFQLPYDIYWLCAHNKLPKMSGTPLKTATSNGSVNVMSLNKSEDNSHKHHKDSDPHDCISDSLNRDLTLPAEKTGEEISRTDPDNKLPDQSDPLEQQKRSSSDAENMSSPVLIMPLSCEERSFILERCIFLVRNYEKMRERHAVLLREGGKERERENKESQCQTGVPENDTSNKSGPAVCITII